MVFKLMFKLISLQGITSGRSLTKSINNKGPKFDPGGTPEDRVNGLELKFLYFTSEILPVR